MYKILIAIAFLLLAPLNFLAQNWAWMKGDSTTIFGKHYYGIKGVANTLNKPGHHTQAAHTTDSLNNLWLFGGTPDDDPIGSNSYNDLWKYNSTTNNWVWVHGDTVVGKKGIYGVQNVVNANNKPGSRIGSIMWTDNAGSLWLFGGFGKGTTNGFLNDIWKYNTVTNEWVWINGDSTTNQLGVYGTKGISNVTNKPGGRKHPAHWIDNSGNFWLFGGIGLAKSGTNGYLNDLWKYNPTSNQWTWINGDSITNKVGIYGNLGVSSSINKPGSRWSSAYWKDNIGNLWLFGGGGYAGINGGALNDLWKYNIISNQWTWIKGSNLYDPPGNYGSLGVSNNQNVPPGHLCSSYWQDAANNFWLHGGSTSTLYGHSNNLWRYNLTSNQWTWIKGDTTLNLYGFYGQQGNFNTANKPGERAFSSFWVNNENVLWLFGGARFTWLNSLFYNDLWKFDLSEYVGLKESVYENNNLKIYPNPTNDIINIEIKEKGDFLLTIYDSQGKAIYTNENINTASTISLKNFATGIYNIVLITEKGIISKKIILN